MSDTFDHELAAWESYDRAFDEGYRHGGRSRTPYERPEQDPNFYHSWRDVSFTGAETVKAVRVRFNGVSFCGPKSLIRARKSGAILVHRATFYSLYQAA
jgi:ribosome modulation factor